MGIAWNGCSRSTCSRRPRTSRPSPACVVRHENVPRPATRAVAGRAARDLGRRLRDPPSHRGSRARAPAARGERRRHPAVPGADGFQRSAVRAIRALSRRRATRQLRRLDPARRARLRSRRRAHAGDVRAGGRRVADRAVPFDSCRHRVRGAPQHRGRLRLDGRRAARPVDADLLARDHAHPALLGAAEFASVVGAGGVAAPRAAGRHARTVHDGAYHPADALGDARGAQSGLHPYRARQGCQRSARGVESRAEKRRHPDRHHRRHRARHSARRLRHHGDDLRLAGGRASLRPGDLQPRLSGGAGGRVPARLDVRPGQPLRRRRVHVLGSANPSVMSTRATALPMPEALAPPRSEWWVFMRRLARRRTSLFGLVVVTAVVATALAAALITPFDPAEQDIGARLKAPLMRDAGGRVHVLGTDHLGRDILARIVFGARPALLVGFAAVAISGVLGMMAGLLAGYFGGRVDDVLMRLADIQLAFPFILLAIAVIGVLGPSLTTIICVIGVSSWVVYARIVRGAALSLREREFVQAAQALGGRDGRILIRHVLPNVFTPWLVVATLDMARVIVIESALSFLGLGVQPPTPTWGGMLADGRVYISTAWWLATFPGLAILVTVLGINLFGDGLRDTLDPRLKL